MSNDELQENPTASEDDVFVVPSNGMLARVSKVLLMRVLLFRDLTG